MVTENDRGSGNTAIVAIVVLVLLAVFAFFFFFNPTGGQVEPENGPDIELEVNPGGGGGGDGGGQDGGE